MKFVDRVKINLRSGNGGNGCCSFRREKFVPRGGPDGGDGGTGGGIYFQGDKGKTTLLDFQFRQHLHAGTGGGGMGKKRHGKRGTPLTLAVPPGTEVKDAESGELLLEILDDQLQLCLAGGRGGRGNARFKTSTHRAPEEFETGQPGVERWVVLELKLMADVGLVGLPNAGKSTLISRVSRARPKIADYPFTTLVPNLGVVKTAGFESFVIADIPGIIAGAHGGAGLGIRFLRHIERTALLLLMLDISGWEERDPLDDYRVLLAEMEAFGPSLLDKPRAVALTKTDLVEKNPGVSQLQKTLAAKGEPVFPISSVTGEGLNELIGHLAREVAAVRGAGLTGP